MNILHPTLPLKSLNCVMSAMSIVAADGITIAIDRVEGPREGYWCEILLTPAVLRELLAAVEGESVETNADAQTHNPVTERNPTMRRDDVFPSNYLQQDDVRTPVIATIERVTLEDIQDGDRKKKKPIAYFSGDLAPLIVNVTNWGTLESAYGPDSDGWIGRAVEIYRDPTVPNPRQPRNPGGIRLRIPANGSAPTGTHRQVAATTQPAAPPAQPMAPPSTPIAPPPNGQPKHPKTFSDGEGNMLTLDMLSTKLVGGFEAAKNRGLLDGWAKWGRQYPFSQQQQDMHEDRYHVALDRLAEAAALNRQRQPA